VRLFASACSSIDLNAIVVLVFFGEAAPQVCMGLAQIQCTVTLDALKKNERMLNERGSSNGIGSLA
jgi:hypothetical protein